MFGEKSSKLKRSSRSGSKIALNAGDSLKEVPSTKQIAEKRGNLRSDLLKSKNKSSSAKNLNSFSSGFVNEIESTSRSIIKPGKSSFLTTKNSSSCGEKLNELVRRKKLTFRKTIETDLEDATENSASRTPNSAWKPRGRLLGQVSVIDSSFDHFRMKSSSELVGSTDWYCGDVKLAVSPNHSKFASGAGDGSLKIWRPMDFMQKKLVHRPILSDKLGSGIVKLEFTSEEALLVATVDGRLLNYKIRDSGALVIDNIKSVDPQTQGRLIEFVTLKHKKPCEVIFGTSHRTISHWDTRLQRVRKIVLNSEIWLF